MFALTNKPEMGARLYSGLIDLASDAERGTDLMQVVQHLSGILVETYMVFDEPDQAMIASFEQLFELLDARPAEGKLPPHTLPPPHILDYETERGRQAARNFFEEWLDCAFEFHHLILVIAQNVVIGWEAEGLGRREALRLLVEATQQCLSYEIAAQELCDVVIDKKVSYEGWSLGDCIASLSAVAGRKLALSLNTDACLIFRGCELPDNLDQVVHVMTQEAVRLGVPAGSDWRFGLAANDMPINAPLDLVYGIEPFCHTFFDVVGMDCEFKQSVACAKAAGRMLAVAAGGELPEIEPAIAKPLAMAAITETYKSVCMDQSVVSV